MFCVTLWFKSTSRQDDKQHIRGYPAACVCGCKALQSGADGGSGSSLALPCRASVLRRYSLSASLRPWACCPTAARARRPRRASPSAPAGAGMSSAVVTQYEVCVLVLGWLEAAKYGRTATAFKREAKAQFRAAGGTAAPPGVKNLLELLNDYVRLKETEAARVALAAASPLAARMLAALDAEAAVATGQAGQQQQQQQQHAQGAAAQAAAGQPRQLQGQGASAQGAQAQWVPQPPVVGAQHAQQQQQRQQQEQAAAYAGAHVAEGGHAMGYESQIVAPFSHQHQHAAAPAAAGGSMPGQHQAATPGRQRKGAPRKRWRGAEAAPGAGGAVTGPEAAGFPAVALFGGDGGAGAGWGSPLDLLNLPLDASGLELLLDDGPMQLAFAEHLAQHINTTGVVDPQGVLAELPADPIMAEVLQQVVRPGTASPRPPSAAAAAPGPRAPSRGAGCSRRLQHAGRRSQQAAHVQQAGELMQPVLPIVSLEPPPLQQQEEELRQGPQQQQEQEQQEQQEQEQWQLQWQQEQQRLPTEQQREQQQREAPPPAEEQVDADMPDAQSPVAAQAAHDAARVPPAVDAPVAERPTAPLQPLPSNQRAASEQPAACELGAPAEGVAAVAEAAGTVRQPPPAAEQACLAEPATVSAAGAAREQQAGSRQASRADTATGGAAAPSCAASEQPAAGAEATAAEMPATCVGSNPLMASQQQQLGSSAAAEPAGQPTPGQKQAAAEQQQGVAEAQRDQRQHAACSWASPPAVPTASQQQTALLSVQQEDAGSSLGQGPMQAEATQRQALLDAGGPRPAVAAAAVPSNQPALQGIEAVAAVVNAKLAELGPIEPATVDQLLDDIEDMFF
ncbi:hypothetical protein ABPG75_000830 [Micractinium tetrahymenae]